MNSSRRSDWIALRQVRHRPRARATPPAPPARPPARARRAARAAPRRPARRRPPRPPPHPLLLPSARAAVTPRDRPPRARPPPRLAYRHTHRRRHVDAARRRRRLSLVQQLAPRSVDRRRPRRRPQRPRPRRHRAQRAAGREGRRRAHAVGGRPVEGCVRDRAGGDHRRRHCAVLQLGRSRLVGVHHRCAPRPAPRPRPRPRPSSAPRPAPPTPSPVAPSAAATGTSASSSSRTSSRARKAAARAQELVFEVTAEGRLWRVSPALARILAADGSPVRARPARPPARPRRPRPGPACLAPPTSPLPLPPSPSPPQGSLVGRDLLAAEPEGLVLKSYHSSFTAALRALVDSAESRRAEQSAAAGGAAAGGEAPRPSTSDDSTSSGNTKVGSDGGTAAAAAAEVEEEVGVAAAAGNVCCSSARCRCSRRCRRRRSAAGGCQGRTTSPKAPSRTRSCASPSAASACSTPSSRCRPSRGARAATAGCRRRRRRRPPYLQVPLDGKPSPGSSRQFGPVPSAMSSPPRAALMRCSASAQGIFIGAAGERLLRGGGGSNGDPARSAERPAAAQLRRPRQRHDRLGRGRRRRRRRLVVRAAAAPVERRGKQCRRPGLIPSGARGLVSPVPSEASSSLHNGDGGGVAGRRRLEFDDGSKRRSSLGTRRRSRS